MVFHQQSLNQHHLTAQVLAPASGAFVQKKGQEKGMVQLIKIIGLLEVFISTIFSLFIKKMTIDVKAWVTLRQNEFQFSVDPQLLTEVSVTEDDIFCIGLLSVNGVCRALGSQKHMGFGFIEVLCYINTIPRIETVWVFEVENLVESS